MSPQKNGARCNKVVVDCFVCGKAIEKIPARAKAGRQKNHFCSAECRNTPCIDMECIQCGKAFKANARTSYKKFCSNECRLAYNRENQVHKNTPKVQLTCERCKKVFEVRRTYRDKQRYCSQKCSGKAIGKSKLGPNSVKWKPKIKITCQICGKEFETFPCRSGRKNCSKQCATVSNLKRFAGGERTDIEKLMATALKKHRINYSEQVILFDKFMVDFLLPSHNIIIQCDGMYWHDRPRARAKDKGQNNYFVKAGYIVLRFTDEQIHKSMGACIATIKKAIQNPQQPALLPHI